jgi:voltage-dependent calcium channel L type alpha-1D
VGLSGGPFLVLDFIFTIIFTVEMVIKIIAVGFIGHPGAYLRNNWNRLDFLVVIFGYVGFLDTGSSNFTVIRTLRVLRPLRTINSVPGMKIIISSLMASIPDLKDVAMLLFFLIFVFGILGVQLYGGALSYRCFSAETGEHTDELCSTETSYGYQCGAGYFCGNWIENPNAGVTAFDNILLAWITIFQMITLEGWTDIMYMVNDVDYKIQVLYFIALVSCGAFFVINLLVAVIFIKYDQMKAQVEEEQAQARELAQEHHEMVKRVATAQLVSKPPEVEDLEQPATAHDRLLAADGETCTQIEMANPNTNSQAKAGIQAPTRKSAFSESEDPSEALIKPKDQSGSDSEGNAADPTTVLIWGHERKLSELSNFERHVLLPCSVIVNQKSFLWFIIGAILVNTLLLAADYDNIAPETTEVLNVCNIILWVLFAIEAIIKILGLGPRQYFSEGFNVFDFFIIMISLVEMVTSPSGSGTFSVLRTFRLLRIFKVFAMSEGLRTLMQAVLSSMEDLFYFSLVFILFLFIYTILGMQVFKGTFVDERGLPTSRTHFDSFPYATLTVFQIITGENWNEVMYTGTRAVGLPVSALYFISCFILGNYILLSLLLAVMLGNFDSVVEAQESIDVVNNVVMLESSREETERNDDEQAEQAEQAETPQHTNSVKKLKANSTSAYVEPEHTPNCCERLFGSCFDMSDDIALDLAKLQPKVKPDKGSTKVPHLERQTARYASASDAPRTGNWIYGNSLFIMPPTNWFRVRVAKVMFHQRFESAILMAIVFSCVLLAMDEPGVTEETDPGLVGFLNTADVVVSVIFTLEMLIRIIALGFIGNRDAYLHSTWNNLDFFLVIMSWVNLLVGDDIVKAFRVFRVLRAMRALRMVSHNERLKLVIQSIFATIFTACNVK